MQSILSRDASRVFDRATIEAGVTGVVLMENAGRGATEFLLREHSPARDELIVVVGGTGNNGGDAWVLTRRLRSLGYCVRSFVVGDAALIRADALLAYQALCAIGEEPITVGGTTPSRAAFERALQQATLIVDGIFGSGLDRPVEGRFADAIEAINAAEADVHALDLPSGIDADSGAELGVSVRATSTSTFAAHKRGLWQTPGRIHAGKIELVDIGVPPPTSDEWLLELEDICAWAPRRPLHSHKGSAGHVLLVAGSRTTMGAGYLAARGALRAGAGLVSLAAYGWSPRVEQMPECMSLGLPDDADVASGVLQTASEGKTAAVVGPGMGAGNAGRRLALSLSKELACPAVLDADALNALAEEDPSTLRDAPAPRVLTPHPKEAARLLQISTGEVQADRVAAARRIAEITAQWVVLKGAGSVIADPGGRLAICPLGTPALGVGGTGDVLAGALGATLGYCTDPFFAACAAVVVHARAGELAACGDRGLLASEVADAIPKAWSEAFANLTQRRGQP